MQASWTIICYECRNVRGCVYYTVPVSAVLGVVSESRRVQYSVCTGFQESTFLCPEPSRAFFPSRIPICPCPSLLPPRPRHPTPRHATPAPSDPHPKRRAALLALAALLPSLTSLAFALSAPKISIQPPPPPPPFFWRLQLLTTGQGSPPHSLDTHTHTHLTTNTAVCWREKLTAHHSTIHSIPRQARATM